MLKLRPRSLSILAGTAIALILSSCGESKVSQCNRLAEVVNQTQGFMQEFETEIQSFSNNAASVETLDDIKEAATQYIQAVDKVVLNLDGLATTLTDTELSDETLVTFRDEYIEVVEGFSRALDEASSAMDLVVTVESEAELPTRIEESQQQTIAAVSQIEELSETESTVIADVNSYCGATPPASSEEAPAETPE